VIRIIFLSAECFVYVIQCADAVTPTVRLISIYVDSAIEVNEIKKHACEMLLGSWVIRRSLNVNPLILYYLISTAQ